MYQNLYVYMYVYMYVYIYIYIYINIDVYRYINSDPIQTKKNQNFRLNSDHSGEKNQTPMFKLT